MDEAKDPEQFYEFELSGWQKSVDAYADKFSPLTRQTIPTILKSLGSIDNAKVLDVACGPGDLARELARSGANVTAIDFSPSMLERARSKSSDDIEFKIDDAETLENFQDSMFDAVVMNYGILHLGRPSRAIQAARRVLMSGGKFVFSCWQNPTKAQGFSAILDAVSATGIAPQGVPHGPNFFEFSDDQNIRSAVAAAGFVKVDIHDVNQTWELPDGETLFNSFLEGTARTGGMLRALSPKDRGLVKDEVVKSAKDRFLNSSNSLTIPMPAKVAVATAP